MDTQRERVREMAHKIRRAACALDDIDYVKNHPALDVMYEIADSLAAHADHADGCEGCIHLSNGRPDVECHPCKRYPHKYPDHYTPKEGDTA